MVATTSNTAQSKSSHAGGSTKRADTTWSSCETCSGAPAPSKNKTPSFFPDLFFDSLSLRKMFFWFFFSLGIFCLRKKKGFHDHPLLSQKFFVGKLFGRKLFLKIFLNLFFIYLFLLKTRCFSISLKFFCSVFFPFFCLAFFLASSSFCFFATKKDQ